MKSSWDDNYKVYICPVCKHTYKERYGGPMGYETEGEKFIEFAEPLLYVKPRDYAPNELVRLIHYACPKCGTTQIDLSDI